MIEAKIKILFVIIFAMFCRAEAQTEFSVIENVSFSEESGLYSLQIDFNHGAKFVPRIHLLPNGVQIFLSFNTPVALPRMGTIDRGIVKGYFFEKFGNSSLMFIMALNQKVVFIKKKYTNSSVSVVFRKKPTIVIDAGHGGRDPGTRSPYDHYSEKNIALITAIELRNALLKTDDYNVVLTRDVDEYLSLDDRIAKANNSGGDFMISIHTDFNQDKNLRGMSVYTLPPSGFTEQDREFNQNLRRAKKFSKDLIGYIPRLCKIKYKPCRSSDLKVLKNNMPSVLVEIACISNPKDSKLLLSKLFREKIIYAMLYALDQFFSKGKQ